VKVCRGADGKVETVFVGGDLEQHFEYTPKDMRAIKPTVPIIAAGEENSQWHDWNGSFRESSR